MKDQSQKSCQNLQNWTLSDLVGAFLDLTLIFFMLCGAFSAFLASKFLDLFGQSLPCSCLMKNFDDYPAKKLFKVQNNIQRRFPFDGSCFNSHFINAQMRNSAVCEMGLEEEICNSVSSSNGIEGKRSNFYGSPLIHESSFVRRRGFKLSSDSPLSHHGSQNSIGKTGTCSRVKARLALSENDLRRGDQRSERIQILEKLIEEERSARLALQIELEKERNAAATAADEAMAMILRLHREKASLEMEARQYERIVEERAAYEDEEMNILKEIIVRRERESHVREKELEFYKLMMVSGDDNQEQSTISKGHNCLEQVEESQLAEENDKSTTVPVANEINASVQSFDSHLPGSSEEIPVLSSAVSLSRLAESDGVQAGRSPEYDEHGGNDEGLENGCGPQDEQIMEKMMNTEAYSLSPIIRGSDSSSCDIISKSNGKKPIDLKRRFSGSASMEIQGHVNGELCGSRRAFQPINMSYDSFSLPNFDKNSMSEKGKERFELEAEIKYLKDRLKIVHTGREKLSSSEHKEKENCPMVT